MKKLILLCVTMLSAALQTSAQIPEALWGKAVQSAGTSMGNDIKMASDGNLFIAGDAGTKTVDDEIYFGEEAVAAPQTDYRGNGDNSNGNLFITKVSPDGTHLWTVFSKYGDAAGSKAYLQPVSDGVVAFVAIRHAVGHGGSSVSIVDAAKQETSLEWTLAGGDADSHRYFIGLIMKLSNEGHIQWIRTLKPTDTASSEAFSPSGIVADEGGNLWIGGTLKKEMSFPTAGGDEVKIAPQAGSDDLLLAKFSQDGYFLQNVQMTGAQKTTVMYITSADNKLYVSGMLTAAAGSDVTFGGKSATIENAFTCMYVAALNSDLSAEFFQPFTAYDKNFSSNIANIYVGSDYLWMSCKVGGNIKTVNDKLLSAENWTRVGMLLKLEKTSGRLLDGYVLGYGQQGVGTNQGGFFAAFEATDGFLYAAEHQLNDRMSIQKFSKDNLDAPVGSWDKMLTYTANVHGIVVADDGKLFTLTRSIKLAATDNPDDYLNYLYGGSVAVVQSSKAFSCNLCAFQLPVLPVSGISDIIRDSNDGGAWYNLRGQRITVPSHGIYIHNGKKMVVK